MNRKLLFLLLGILAFVSVLVVTAENVSAYGHGGYGQGYGYGGYGDSYSYSSRSTSGYGDSHSYYESCSSYGCNVRIKKVVRQNPYYGYGFGYYPKYRYNYNPSYYQVRSYAYQNPLGRYWYDGYRPPQYVEVYNYRSYY